MPPSGDSMENDFQTAKGSRTSFLEPFSAHRSKLSSQETKPTASLKARFASQFIFSASSLCTFLFLSCSTCTAF